MKIDEAMKIQRCITALSTGGKTLEELVNVVGLDEGETQDGFYAFVLMLAIANLVGLKGDRYVLSGVFLDAAAYQLAEAYGGKTLYVKKLNPVTPGEILSAICGVIK